MRLLRTGGEDLSLETFNDERKLPEYAILSHTWLADQDEISFDDVRSNTSDATIKAGWRKLNFARKEAHENGLGYLWVDTCCIDKSSSAELAEAINSMYRWYQKSKVCYIHLADMPEPHKARSDRRSEAWYWDIFRQCRYFSRGWTLQEMIAPSEVQLFSSNWGHIGSLFDLAGTISGITGVHLDALLKKRSLQSFSIAQRMSWAAHRVTTRAEDQAYSLLGIFEVNMPIIYGEGGGAFMRLQDELLRTQSDPTIFAWSARDDCWNPGGSILGDKSRDDHGTPQKISLGSSAYDVRALKRFPILAYEPQPGTLLAKSAYDFRNCKNLVPVQTEGERHRSYDVTSSLIRFQLPLSTGTRHSQQRSPPWFDRMKAEAVLSCRFQDDYFHAIVLRLRSTETKNTFLVSDEREHPRVAIRDLLAISATHKTSTFSVARKKDTLDSWLATDERTIILCKFQDFTGYPLRTDEFHMASVDKFFRVHWNRTTATGWITGSRQGLWMGRTTFPALATSECVDVWSGDHHCCSVMFGSSDEGQRYAYFRGKASQPLWTVLVPPWITLHQGIILIASFRLQNFLHGQTPMLQIDLCSPSTTFRRLVCHELPARMPSAINRVSQSLWRLGVSTIMTIAATWAMRRSVGAGNLAAIIRNTLFIGISIIAILRAMLGSASSIKLKGNLLRMARKIAMASLWPICFAVGLTYSNSKQNEHGAWALTLADIVLVAATHFVTSTFIDRLKVKVVYRLDREVSVAAGPSVESRALRVKDP